MPVPNIFATATTSIPLANLDANFAYFANAITVSTSTTALTINANNQMATGIAGTASLPSFTRAGDENTGIFFPAADTIAFAEGGTEALRINANAQLATNIAGTASLPSFTRVGDENTGIFFPAADTIAFAEGGAEAMRIDSSSALLVGLTSVTDSQAKIHAYGSQPSITIESSSTSDAVFKAKTTLGVWGVGVGINTTTNCLNFFNFGTTTETMRIASDGNVLVGTTSLNGSVSNTRTLVSGTFRSFATSGGLANGAVANLFTIPTDSSWLVFLQTANAGGLATTAIVTLATGGNAAQVTVLKADNGAFTVILNGTTLQASNNLGGPINYGFTAIRLY